MTAEEAEKLAERLENQAKGDAWHCTALAATAIRTLMRERDEALEVLRVLLADCRYHLSKYRPGPLKIADAFLAAHDGGRDG